MPKNTLKFGGYVTRYGVKCTDGRTIAAPAFQHQNGDKVPLVWKHLKNSPENVLGHVVLEHRDDGVYGTPVFNNTAPALHAQESLRNGDYDSLSIRAINLMERGQLVHGGDIEEVSLVFRGANSGAHIEFLDMQHESFSDDGVEAIIYSGEMLEHEDGDGDNSVDDSSDEDDSEETVEDIVKSMTDKQQEALAYLITEALQNYQVEDDDSDDSDESDDNTAEQSQNETPSLTHQNEGTEMPRNVFEQNAAPAGVKQGGELTHEQISDIFAYARDNKSTLQHSIAEHADQYGITNIETLFPDPKAVEETPELISRKQEWVSEVLNGVSKRPWSRIKTLSADVTHEEARAKGYVKNTMKKDEFFSVAQRSTTPTTIYKKQKLDRDDIIDITSFDVVAWLRAEMRMMLDEEIARAILVGDGRDIEDTDKVREPAPGTDGVGVRSILNDHAFYVEELVVPTNVVGDGLVDAVLRVRPKYKGTNPTFFCTEDTLTDLLLIKDKLGQRIYKTEEELKAALRVSKITPVPVMEGVSKDGNSLMGLIVNLVDYAVGTDRGGEITNFDDFDIDFNQYKYLMEGRMSGALLKHKRAIRVLRANGTEVVPTAPTLDEANGRLNIPNVTGVQYRVNDENQGAGNVQLEDGVTVYVSAVPKPNHFFPSNITTEWSYRWVQQPEG